ncbi:MAG: hypothetical protein ABSE73_12430 [Planctomycetota bacterium]
MRATRCSWLGRLWLLPCAVALGWACAPAAREEEADPPAEDIRYDLLKMEGKVYRFDRKTSEINELVRTKAGFDLVPQPVHQVPPRPAGETPLALPRTGRIPDDTAPPQADATPKKAKAPIEIFDDQGNDITYQITDQDREAAKGAIQAYREELSLSHSLDMGERIKGSFLVRNRGNRRLKVLELLLQAPVAGHDKPEEHRFLYVDRPGQPGPPQPATAGNEGNFILQKVDIPSPPGGLKGQPDLKVSYLKFAD